MSRYSRFGILLILSAAVLVSQATDVACTLPSGAINYWPARGDNTNDAGPADVDIDGEGGETWHGYQEFFETEDSSMSLDIVSTQYAAYQTSSFSVVLTAYFGGVAGQNTNTDNPNEWVLISVGSYPDAANSPLGWGLYCDSTTGILTLFIGDGVGAFLTTAGSACVRDTWQVYTVVSNGATTVVYVNGVQQITSSSAIKYSATTFTSVTDWTFGNDVDGDQSWNGGIVDIAWFNVALTSSFFGGLRPFVYPYSFCHCPAAAVVTFNSDLDLGAACTDSPDTDTSHYWDYSGSSDVFDDDGDADGTYFGSVSEDNNGLYPESDGSTILAVGTYATGTFESDSHDETPFACATWSVFSVLKRDSVLSQQAVLSGGKGSSIIGFHPTDSTKIGLFDQFNLAEAVWVTVSGGFLNTITYIAVTFISTGVVGTGNVTINVQTIGGTTSTYSAVGTISLVTTNNTWFSGGQSAQSGNNGGSLEFDRTLFYPQVLSPLEINNLFTDTTSGGTLTGGTGGSGTGGSGTGGNTNTKKSSSASTAAGGGGGKSSSTGGGAIVTPHSSSAAGNNTNGGGGVSSSAGGGGGGSSSSSASLLSCAMSVLLIIVACLL